MTASIFQPHVNRFIFLGLLLAAAGDVVGPGYYQFLKNVRSIQNGVIEPRKGMIPINATPINSIHSIKRLNDDNSIASQAFQRFIGNSTSLHSDNATHNAFSSIASGFSGNPLSMIPFAPNEAAEPYLYVADANKLGKAKAGSGFLNWGIASPIVAATAALAQLQFNAYASLTTGAANSWTAGGTTSVTAVNQSRTNTTITRILYDSGSAGWASIQPASFQEINVGARVTLAASEQVLVEAVFEAAHTTTIAAIQYDSGSTGLCSIVLTATSKAGIRRDASLLLNSSEMVRILDVVEGPNNSLSIRVSTVGTFSAGQAVAGLATFRCFTSGTFAATNTITETVHRLSVTSGLGLYSNSAASLDMSFIAGRPMTPNDFIHISVKVDLPANLTEGKLMLDCAGDGVNDFTKNYFYFAFNSNDFTPAVNDQITTLLAKQTKLQRRLIDLQNRQAKQAKLDALNNQLANIAARIKSLQETAATPPLGVGSDTSARFETVAGASQWTDFWIRLDENHLTRVGSDTSRGLADIKAIRLQFNVTATTVIDVADFYYGGGYGTEVTPVGTPYIYAYRYRASATGEISAWSPPMRTGIMPRRQKVTLTPTLSADSQVDKIDWVRFGGTLNKWLYLGTQPNSGTFDDELSDAELIGRDEFNLIEGWQPFVTLDNPFTGVVNVCGCTVTGINFNTKWIAPYRGMQVIINGQTYTLFAPPTSSTLMYLNENAGSQSGVSIYIPSPELSGQPMPFVFGPYNSGGQSASVMFALGDLQNAGTLLWTNGDNPGLMRDTNFYYVSSPSEQLVTGGLLDGRAFVFTEKRMYWIYPSQDANGLLTFYAQDSGCDNAPINRWCLTTGNGQIFFVGRDGIYVTNGGQPQRITDAIYNIFPHDGTNGSTTNGVVAPDYNNTSTFMLEYGDGYIYFDYLGIDAVKHTLVGDTKQAGGIAWSNDEYSPTVNMHYYEEGKGVHSLLMGSSDGRVYSYGGLGDGAASSTPISCEVRPGNDDQEAPFNKKEYRDLRIDYDPQGVNIVAQVGLDNYTTLPTPTTLVNSSGRRQQELDLALYAKNITVDLSWSSATASPKLYIWSPYYIIKPEDIRTAITDADNLGTLNAKFVQGFKIQSNTYNAAKSFKVQADNGVNGVFVDIQTFSITSNGESTQAFSFTTPFICHEVRIVGADAIDWSIIQYEFVWEPIPELVTQWIPQETTLDMQGYGFIRYFQIPHISTANLTLAVQTIDGITNPIDTYTILHGSGNYTKSFQPVIARKGKAFKPSITSSAGFRLFQRDFECKYGQWNRGQSQLLTALPIGDISRTSGARI